MDPHFTLLVTSTTALLTVDGELDLASRADLLSALDEAEHLARAVLRLELSGVTFVDGTCLRVIDRSRRRVEADGHTFDVAEASLSFRLVSSLAGYDALNRPAVA